MAEIKIEGTVRGTSRLGGIIPSFSVQEFIAAGFAYGDLVNIVLGNDGIYTVPFVTNYTDAGCLGLVLVDYRASGRGLALSISNETLDNILSCNPGERFDVTLRERGGYLDMYRAISTIYTDNPAEYATREEFANFRPIRTTGVGEGVLYRSSNPLNGKRNQARRAVADSLCAKAGIRTELDFGDDPEDVFLAQQEAGFGQGYCTQLYLKGHTCLGRLKGGVFTGDGPAQVARALRFMLTHEAPYLVHCDEGKDRAGLVCMLLEALAGATLEELQTDYMQTFCNFYHLEPGSEKYMAIQDMTIKRLLYILAHPEKLERVLNLNWTLVKIGDVHPTLAAARYCREQLGFSEAEVQELRRRLAGA